MFSGEMLWSLPGLLVAIVFHEYAHARMAHELGDPTPAYTGRLTLNPLAHLDPIGLLMLWLFRFGWAKPVQVNPYNFRDARRGMLLVSVAGPGMNLILAFVALLFLRLPFADLHPAISRIVWWIMMYNVWLALFNLIPVPPLDGSKVLASLLPPYRRDIIAFLEQYGFLILIALIVSGIVWRILNPLAHFILGLFDLLVGLLLWPF